jgi:hypothetical protein
VQRRRLLPSQRSFSQPAGVDPKAGDSTMTDAANKAAKRANRTRHLLKFNKTRFASAATGRQSARFSSVNIARTNFASGPFKNVSQMKSI